MSKKALAGIITTISFMLGNTTAGARPVSWSGLGRNSHPSVTLPFVLDRFAKQPKIPVPSRIRTLVDQRDRSVRARDHRAALIASAALVRAVDGSDEHDPDLLIDIYRQHGFLLSVLAIRDPGTMEQSERGAVQAYQQALNLARASPEPDLYILSDILQNLAGLSELVEPQRTIVYLQELTNVLEQRLAEAVTNQDQEYRTQAYDLAMALYTFAITLSQADRQPETLAVLRRALEVIQLSGRERDELGIALRINVAATTPNPDEAEAMLLDVLAELNDVSQLKHRADALRHLAARRFEAHRFEGAHTALSEAIQIYERLGHVTTIDSLNESLAQIYVDAGRGAEAEMLFRQAISRVSAQRDDAPYLAPLRSGLARSLLMQNGDAEEAFTLAQSAVAIRRRSLGALFRGGVAEEFAASRIEIDTAGMNRMFLDAAWLVRARAGNSDTMEAAFASAQEALASPASGAVIQAAIRRSASSPILEALVRERKELAQAWASAQDALANPSAGRIGSSTSQMNRQIEETRSIAESASSLDQQIAAEFPQFDTLLGRSIVSSPQSRTLLGSNEAMLMVVPSEFGTHIFLVKQTELVWERSSSTGADIDQLVQTIRATLNQQTLTEMNNSAGMPGTVPAFPRGAAYDLYRAIFTPIEEELVGITSLYVVTADALSNLPFSVLVTDEPHGSDSSASDLRDTAWLANSFALVHLPSIQTLLLARQSAVRDDAGSAIRPFVGFGDPALGSPQVAESEPVNWGTVVGLVPRSGQSVADGSQLRRLPDLPGTSIELENLRLALGGRTEDLHVRAAATEGAVKRTELERIGVLAFATHGLLAGELRAAEPGLGSVDKGDSQERWVLIQGSF